MEFLHSPKEGEQCIVNKDLYEYRSGIWKNLTKKNRKTLGNPLTPAEPCKTLSQTIRIKRSRNIEKPPSLKEGELAYSFASKKLFIGDKDGKVIAINK